MAFGFVVSLKDLQWMSSSHSFQFSWEHPCRYFGQKHWTFFLNEWTLEFQSDPQPVILSCKLAGLPPSSLSNQLGDKKWLPGLGSQLGLSFRNWSYINYTSLCSLSFPLFLLIMFWFSDFPPSPPSSLLL